MKKNVVSKLLAGVLALSMIFSMAACGEENDNSGSSASNTNASSSPVASSSVVSTPEPTSTVDMTPMTITVGIPSDVEHQDGESPEYDRMVKTINDYTSMDIKWSFIASATYYEQLALKVPTGNIYDVSIFSTKDALFVQACADGLFWDLTDYLDDYDNLSAISMVCRMNLSVDGRLYGLPRSRNLARNGFGYRKDWCDKLNIKEPETWDDFVKMCNAFTFQDPDGNGEQDTVGIFLDAWTGAFDIMETWFGVPNEWGIDANGDLIPKCLTEEYMTAWTAFRDLYASGVINKNWQDVGAGKARNNMRDGLGGFYPQVLDDCRKVETYFEDSGLYGATAENPAFVLGGYILTESGNNQPLVFPTAGYNGFICVLKGNDQNGGAVKTEAQLKRVLQFLNDMNDGEMLTLVDYGFEGLSYEIDADGYISIFDSEKKAAQGVGDAKYHNSFNQIPTYFTAEENAREHVVPPSTSVIMKMEETLKAENEKYCVANYGASYTSQTYVELGSTLDQIINDAKIKYFMGEIDKAGFEAAIKTWREAGGDKVIKEMNEKFHAAGN